MLSFATRKGKKPKAVWKRKIMKPISHATCSQARSWSWAQSQPARCSADLKEIKTIRQLESVKWSIPCCLSQAHYFYARAEIRLWSRPLLRLVLCWYVCVFGNTVLLLLHYSYWYRYLYSLWKVKNRAPSLARRIISFIIACPLIKVLKEVGQFN